MGRAFNFFQTNQSGEVSAFSGNFSDFFTPSGMFNSPDSYYLRLDHDVYETPLSHTFVVTPKFVTSNPDYYNLGVGIRGGAFGIKSGDAFTHLYFTGNFQAGRNDVSNFYSSLSGQIKNANVDASLYNFNFIFVFPKVLLDVPTLFYNFSGNINSGTSETSSFNTNFSGNFFKYERERVSLNAEMHSITWGVGNVLITSGQVTGEANFSVTLNQILWSRAG